MRRLGRRDDLEEFLRRGIVLLSEFGQGRLHILGFEPGGFEPGSGFGGRNHDPVAQILQG